MELLLILGLVALVVLMGLGALAFLRNRRGGTVLAVSVARRLPGGPSRRSSHQAASEHQ